MVEIAGGDFGLARGPITLKLEQLQHSGSFKARGAFANLLLREVPKAGVQVTREQVFALAKHLAPE